MKLMIKVWFVVDETKYRWPLSLTRHLGFPYTHNMHRPIYKHWTMARDKMLHERSYTYTPNVPATAAAQQQITVNKYYIISIVIGEHIGGGLTFVRNMQFDYIRDMVSVSDLCGQNGKCFHYGTPSNTQNRCSSFCMLIVYVCNRWNEFTKGFTR